MALWRAAAAWSLQSIPMPFAEFTALLLLSTAASFSPGPNTALGANLGLRHALRFVCAVPVGWGILFVLCATGLGGLVVAFPPLRWGIVVLGNGYLLWLASRLWGSGSLQLADSVKLQVGFVQGVGLQFLYIKAWMLALAIVAGWVAGREDATARTLVLLPIIGGVVLASTSELSFTWKGFLSGGWASMCLCSWDAA